MDKEKKTNIINNNRTKKEDTGSTEIQIAILSARITELLNHFKKNPKDKHSNRGLVAMVNNRKKHLKYLRKKDSKKHKAIIKKLGLKETK